MRIVSIPDVPAARQNRARHAPLLWGITASSNGLSGGVSGEMPITPFHIGPGLLIKAAIPRHFSLIAFAIVQVAIDMEVIVNVARGHDPLHEFLHTWVGSLLIGAGCAVLLLMAVPRVSDFAFSRRHERHPWSLLAQDYAPLAILNGVFIGALSHVALDGFMHAELNTPWLNLIDVGDLHWFCLLAGLAGLSGVVTSRVFR